MANDLNKVIQIGRLTKDPELRYTQGGSSVANFSIAVNRSYKVNDEKREETSFFNCIAWGKLGEIIAEHCKKGQRIGIDGRLQQRSWDDNEGKKRYSIEIVVDNFQFLSSKGEAAPDEVPASEPESSEPIDENIPF